MGIYNVTSYPSSCLFSTACVTTPIFSLVNIGISVVYHTSEIILEQVHSCTDLGLQPWVSAPRPRTWRTPTRQMSRFRTPRQTVSRHWCLAPRQAPIYSSAPHGTMWYAKNFRVYNVVLSSVHAFRRPPFIYSFFTSRNNEDFQYFYIFSISLFGRRPTSWHQNKLGR